MLKRIAVLGGNEAELRKAADERGLEEVEIVPVAEGADLPAGCAAVLGKEALEAGLNMAARHEQLLELVALAVTAREQYLPHAPRRMHEHATRFAQALGLNNEERSRLERGALLADIGKLRIPNDILLKKTVLTYDEWTTLQNHTKLGAELVVELEAFADTAQIVQFHHECFDGTGYPDGLEADGIPRLARAMKILDVYCAMTSPRHYRSGYCSHSDALDYLRGESGKHFDPELLRAFIDGKVGQDLDATT